MRWLAADNRPLSIARPALRQAQGPASRHHGPVLRQAQQPPPLQLQPIHIRIPLLKAKRDIKGVGLHAGGLGGKAKVDGSEFVFGKVNDPLQERTADPLAPIGREDHDVLDTRLAAGRRLEDAQGGAADDVLLIVLRDKNPRSRRCHRTLLLLRVHRDFRVQLLHQAQQILDLGSCQSAKFKVSHSIIKKGLCQSCQSVRPFDKLRDRPILIPSGPLPHSGLDPESPRNHSPNHSPYRIQHQIRNLEHAQAEDQLEAFDA